ncbi:MULTISPECIES: hypothetical protein [Euryhalocaulis]|uniref:hypothetical protein n=1 Tax=Euryhalocaulis TaxID=1712422 RepID=UPI0003A13E7B|nr:MULTISPECIES: hypothetical protein [Euryhalocaulis]MBA4801860.1 hypothetical protein [Euryhalocaulis sp.]
MSDPKKPKDDKSREEEIDESLDETFPASDPPSYMPPAPDDPDEEDDKKKKKD